MDWPERVSDSRPTAPLRLVFFGTPELARTLLIAIAAEPSIQVAAVVTQPDRPIGRGLQVAPPPVKQEAGRLGLPVLQPESARNPRLCDQLGALHPDLGVVAAYGQILPQAVLEIPIFGCLNVHTSLLPRWRGAAPIQWAIAAGDSETGVTLMRMDAGLDTGPMVATARTPIRDDDTSATLHDRLAALGAALLLETIPEYVAGRRPPQPQPSEGITYARRIQRADGRLDWNQPAVVLWRRLRAFTPWPGAHAFIPAASGPRLLKIHSAVPELPTGEEAPRALPGQILGAADRSLRVACGDGVLRLTEVQPEGGRRMDAAAFLAGHPVTRLE